MKYNGPRVCVTNSSGWAVRYMDEGEEEKFIWLRGRAQSVDA